MIKHLKLVNYTYLLTCLSEASKACFRRRAETRGADNISARLGLACHTSVLDKENIAMLKQLYYDISPRIILKSRKMYITI